MDGLPFHRFRRRGVDYELCVVCGSHRENPEWGCPTCVQHKPKVSARARDGRFSDMPKGQGRSLARTMREEGND